MLELSGIGRRYRVGAEEVTALADIDLSFQATKNINVAIGANNFFDTYPDKNTLPDTNGFPPYPAQSPFGFYGGYYYGRLSFSF